jgi:hypothetical protein
VTVCWWADVTEVLADPGDHELELWLEDLPAHQFLGPWLEAPGARWDLVEPGIVSLADGVRWDTPIPDAALAPPAATPGPRVLDAWLVPHELRAGESVTIHARPDPDAGPLSGVFVSTIVGAGVLGDTALTPQADGTWSHTWRMGDRREVILDPASSHVWAVAEDGRMGPTVAVPMRWHLPPRERSPGTTGALDAMSPRTGGGDA